MNTQTIVKVNIDVVLDVRMGIGSAFCEMFETSQQGRFPEGTRYKDLVKIFGEPQFGESIDGKIQVEWVGKINGSIFTIYDYNSKVNPKQNTDWHIGGKHAMTADLVKAYFAAALLT